MNPEILIRVKGIAAELFDVPASKLDPESSPAKIESWDSVQHLNLILELEQAFGVKLEPEDIEQVRTLGDAARLVEAKRR